ISERMLGLLLCGIALLVAYQLALCLPLADHVPGVPVGPKNGFMKSPVLTLRWFRCLCGTPERTRIDPVRVQCQHFPEELRGGRGIGHTPVKVMEVASGFLNVARRAIGFQHAMTGDHHSRIEGLDFIERGEPLESCFLVALSQIRMRVVIDSIPRYHQTHRRHMQSGCMRGIGMAEFHHEQAFSFQVESVSLQNLRQGQLSWYLAGKSQLPEGSYEVWLYLVLHRCNNMSGGKRSCIWEPVQQELQA